MKRRESNNGPEPTAEQRAEADQFLRGGIDLEADIESAGIVIRERSKAAYEQEWLDARLMLMSVCRKVQAFRSGVPGLTDQSKSDRLALITVFLQGATITEKVISEGQYTKAGALLKQDYELLTRVREIKAGAAKPGRTPNVRHAPAGSQHFYGQLNDVAHPSNANIINDVLAQLHSGDAHGLSSVPIFLKETARSLYELHVWLLLEMAREALLLAGEMYPDDRAELADAFRWFITALDALERAGFVVGDDESDLARRVSSRDRE